MTTNGIRLVGCLHVCMGAQGLCARQAALMLFESENLLLLSGI